MGIERVDKKDIKSKIISKESQKRKDLKINKSAFWYQQRKIKEGKAIKVYEKTRVSLKL